MSARERSCRYQKPGQPRGCPYVNLATLRDHRYLKLCISIGESF
jgi:hypothetical protein